MSAATATVLILAALSYLLKATGPLFLGGRKLPAAVATVAYKIPGPLLAALVLTSAVTDGPTFVFNARIVGLLAAIVALRFRASLSWWWSSQRRQLPPPVSSLGDRY